MAKEMMIIFVYDTELLQNEEDDPASAILYFHPGWVSDQQRTSLCGQIIGTCHFLSTAFKSPRIFALQSGKFSIRTYGRYILAVGTDRNIADWVLEHRSETLSSLISFFHHGFQKLSELYSESTNLSAKLYHMFETYLKILMYGGHMFYNIPTIQLPKSASHVFLEAIQLLQGCQEMNHVLGGTILYHNKVVATQLSSDLTKRLVLTDPYRIKSPAEAVTIINFSLPSGVQLLQVYIAHEDYQQLHEDAVKCRSIPRYLTKIDTKKISTRAMQTREPILSAMKRDQSLIFTTVPEEDSELHSPINLDDVFKKAKSPDRPKFLNLKSKTTDSKIDVIGESKPVPSTPFFGQTSVCSTPMTDLNKVLHQNIMSICLNPEETDQALHENLDNSGKNFTNVERIRSVNDAGEKSGNDRLSKYIPYVPVDGNVHDKKKSASMWEVREKLKSFNKRITMRYYSFGLPNLNDDLEIDLGDVPKKCAYKTIADPLYPIFKSSGMAISNFLYNQHLQHSMNIFDNELKQKKAKIDTDVTSSIDSQTTASMNQPPNPSPKKIIKPTKECRKGLTLPLKSLTSSSTEQSDNIFSPVNRGRNMGGVQLTPLMSKLSLLAMEEKSSGFCSRDTTPDARFTPSQLNYSFLNSRRKSSVSDELADDKTENLHKVALFVYGQQDMVMGLLLDESISSVPEIINRLFEKCTESLGKLERQLCHSLETYPCGSSQSESGEPYSYLCMDPQWDTLQRGGPWGSIELGALTHLHKDFINMSNLTEIILRNDESIIYGHHCGKTEVFYQQAISSGAGLPTPADSMGTVSLKAKRRLERDHAIILL